jgi:NADPH:quinone reductase-like Zn-dependent oxidoreductase
MRAVVRNTYGSPDVVEIAEIDKPEPGEGEILVRVRAASVNPADWYTLTGPFVARIPNGLRKPKSNRLGTDYAGQVEAVGANVTEFRPGDEVFGGRTGALAEYVAARADRGVVAKPPNLTFDEAAAVPIAALTALQGLRDKGHVQAGQRVLVNGASGGVGTFAVQIAKAFGAEVTGVCSTRNVEIARSLGADHVVDYTTEDFTRSDRRYDLILDVAGSKTWSELRRVLEPKGTVVIVGAPKKAGVLGPLGHIVRLRLASVRGSQKAVFFVAKFNKADMETLRELLEGGKVKPVVDRRYDLVDVADAFRYLGDGHAQGKVVVTVS